MPIDVMPKQAQSETYLGDGLYASFDGYQVWLRAPREDGDHCIALEPSVYFALQEFVKGLRREALPITGASDG